MERKLTQLIDKALSRRTFLAGAGATAAGTVLAGCGNGGAAPVTPSPTPTPTPATLTDADYLNFALNLEYLEAEFYLRAATGNGLTSADSGNATSLTTGGPTGPVPGLMPYQQEYIYEIAQNELDHVRLLRGALTSAAVSAPAIELSASFNALVAGFNPFTSYGNYLIGAFVFEDVGVTAYHGAAKLLTSKANLTVAAEIHAVEAYHAGSIRTQIFNAGATLIGMANAVQTLRSTLGGFGYETMLSASGGLVAAAANTSIGFERTTDQVLHIVYGMAGGAGVSSGAFFPKGLNGNIKVTTT